MSDLLTQNHSELVALQARLKALNAQVKQLQVSINTLSSANTHQSALIASQTESLQTAYYIVGKSKELTHMKVIDKNGGLLGLGKTVKLNPDFCQKIFTKVNITQFLTIHLNSKKSKIITTHPKDSYVLEISTNNASSTLLITHPEKFWSASKYLVIINN
ncbi:MAG: hypothetical protein HYX39_07945 [Bacteroidetes bacterium]|nr:hypothetical protein [Bacteroidota bacterium]